MNLSLKLHRDLFEGCVKNGALDQDEVKKFLETGQDLSPAAKEAALDRIARLKDLTPTAGQLEFLLTSRLVFGAGTGGIMDVGLEVDWITGWPWVSGAAFKGCVRGWVENWATESDLLAPILAQNWDAEDLDDVYGDIFGFGPDPKTASAGWAGSIIFHDGILGADTQIVQDVMTPHHKDFHQWNEKSGDKAPSPPADYDNPIPIIFLAVDAGAKLSTGLALRDPSADAGLLEVAKAWLTSALGEAGIGAKTAAGYGRARPVRIEPTAARPEL